MHDDDRKQSERRDSQRAVANFKCLCSGFWRKGSGVLTSISGSGALLEETSFVPVGGELVGLSLDLPLPGASLLIGWVSRHTDSGFAIEFDKSDAETQRLAREIAAIVPMRSRGDRQTKS